uniref:Uncharacterized protein n=1 Tax=Triticum urartu TaxID=4572 RepID=A0A8R7NVB8_TRIUA
MEKGKQSKAKTLDYGSKHLIASNCKQSEGKQREASRDLPCPAGFGINSIMLLQSTGIFLIYP